MLTRCSLCTFSPLVISPCFHSEWLVLRRCTPKLILHLRAILSPSRMQLLRFVLFSTRLSLGLYKLPIIFISNTRVASVCPYALLIGYLIKIKLMDCLWFIIAFHCPNFWIEMEDSSEFPFSFLINVGNVQFGRKWTIIGMRPSCTSPKILICSQVIGHTAE